MLDRCINKLVYLIMINRGIHNVDDNEIFQTASTLGTWFELFVIRSVISF